MIAWFDMAHFNTVIMLAVLGFVARWIIRVNTSFHDLEELRRDVAADIAALAAELAEHEAVSEQVHVDIARRLEHLEGWPPARNGPSN